MIPRSLFLAAAAIAACAVDASAQPSHPPIEAFGQLPAISQPLLSPDGKHFADIQPIDGQPAAVIYTVGGGTPPVAIPSHEDIIDRIYWAKNDRLLVALKKNTTIEWSNNPNQMRTLSRTFSVNLDGTETHVLLNNLSLNFNTGEDIDDLDVRDPDHVYVSIYVDAGSNLSNTSSGFVATGSSDLSLSVFRVNVRTGDNNIVVMGSPVTSNIATSKFLMDGNGNLVGRIDHSNNPSRDFVKIYSDGRWNPLADYEASADIKQDFGAQMAGVGEDSKSFVRYAIGDNGMYYLQRLDSASAATSVLYENPNFDVENAIYDEWTNAVVGAVYFDDRPQQIYFDDQRSALQRGLQQAFPGLNVHAASADLTRDHVIVEASGPRQPPGYFFLDRTTHQAQSISPTYPSLSESDLGEMKPYPYKARDGLEIPAYITLPPGRDPNNLPAVVMPHGGPEARDSIGFDWWAQFLANRGYAVLQPNYRGSSGYGRKFAEAGFKQWGLKMQDDITDGVRKMIADKIADSKRICIVGASYGGYAALAGAAFTPDLYACAFSFAGISDLSEMIYSERKVYGKESDVAHYWDSRIGDPFHDSDRLDKTSPALHADQVKCPVLLMHGEGDTTVPIEQSERMNDALLRAGKSVRFIKLPREDHYLNLAETRIRMLTELEAFLAANIGH